MPEQDPEVIMPGLPETDDTVVSDPESALDVVADPTPTTPPAEDEPEAICCGCGEAESSCTC